MRINKFLTDADACSRRAADKLITQGKVRINQRIATLGDRVAENDQVFVNGKRIAPAAKKVYLAYHKPEGVVSTADPAEKNNIVKAVGFGRRVYPVGRLDAASTGLILLTNDGAFVQRILRAHNKVEKEYVVAVDLPLTPSFLRSMRNGVVVLGRKTMPATVEQLGPKRFSIILNEGRNRQIRRMCGALGFTVLALKRVRIGTLMLGNLKKGEHRVLLPHEVQEYLAGAPQTSKA